MDLIHPRKINTPSVRLALRTNEPLVISHRFVFFLFTLLLLSSSFWAAAITINPSPGLPSAISSRSVPLSAQVLVSCRDNPPPACGPQMTVTFTWADAMAPIPFYSQSTYTILRPYDNIVVPFPPPPPIFQCSTYANCPLNPPPIRPPSGNLVLTVTATDGVATQTLVQSVIVPADQTPHVDSPIAPNPYTLNTLVPVTLHVTDEDDAIGQIRTHLDLLNSSNQIIGTWDSTGQATGKLLFNPPSTLDSNGKGITYSLSIDCRNNGCSGPLTLRAMASDPSQRILPPNPLPYDVSLPVPVSITIQPASSVTIPAPIPTVTPPSPTPSDTVRVTATQPSGPPIDAHEYVWSINNGPATTQVIPSSNGVSSSIDFCTPRCKAQDFIAVQVRAKKGNDYSQPVVQTVTIVVEQPAIPLLVEFSPGPATSVGVLNSGQVLTVNPAPSYHFKFAQSKGNLVVDYIYQLEVDGQMSGYQPPSNSDGTVTLDCSTLNCASGPLFKLTAWSRHQGMPSPPRFVLLKVRPTNAPAKNLTGLCASASIWQYLSAMGIGLMLMIIIIALVYMMGESLHLPHLIDWAKTEALQMGMAIVLFIVIAFLINTECSLRMGEFLQWTGLDLPGAIVTSDTTMLQAAQNYMQWSAGQAHVAVVMIRRDMGALNIRATYSNFDNQLPVLGQNGFSYTPFSGDWTMLGTLGMLLNLNTSFLLAALMELFSLAFFASANGLFIFLVPIGLVLRSLPFLRHFGGGLVAIAVGFYIFYPLTFAMLALTLPPLYHGQDADDIARGFGLSCPASNDPTAPACLQEALTSEQTLTGSFGEYLVDHPAPWIEPCGDSQSSLSCVPNPGVYFKLTALNFIRAIFLPTVALLLTVTFVRDLSALFGEEVDAGRLIQLV